MKYTDPYIARLATFGMWFYGTCGAILALIAVYCYSEARPVVATLNLVGAAINFALAKQNHRMAKDWS